MIPVAERHKRADPSDENLIHACLEGDQAAAAALFGRYNLMIFNLALGILNNPEDAKDACQESFIKAFARLGSFRFESAFSTWLYRVAIRTIFKARSHDKEARLIAWKENSGPVEDTSVWLVEEMPDLVNPSPYILLVLEELRFRCTLGMLLCLDRRHRAAFLLRVLGRISFEEIAAVLKTTPVNVRKMFSRGASRLGNFMQENCGVFNPDCKCHCQRTKAFAAWARGEEIQADAIHAALFARNRSKVQGLVTETMEDLQELGNQVAAQEFRNHCLVGLGNPREMLETILENPAFKRLCRR